MRQVLTLTYLLGEDEICLALKKRGFGEGNWNGFGGKLEGSETIYQGAVREVKEESGVTIRQENLEKVALVDFIYVDEGELEVHTFFVREWEGEPQETNEMKPKWFMLTEIPYEDMWADDIHWLPRALRGEKLRGRVWFKENGRDIERMEWKETDEF